VVCLALDVLPLQKDICYINMCIYSGIYFILEMGIFLIVTIKMLILTVQELEIVDFLPCEIQ
jgi:hypothetical protein